MTSSLSFWKSWLSGYRFTWYFLAGLFICTLVFLWFAYFQDTGAVIHWQKYQEQKVVESTIHTFQAGPFTFAVPAENFVITEYFGGSNIVPNTQASYLYLLVLAISAVVLFTVITMLDRFWYITGTVLFILFVFSLRLKVIALFGQVNNIPAITLLVVFIGISAWFNIFRPGVRFTTRLLIYSVLMIIAGILIGLYAEVRYPFLHLAVTSYTAALVLTVLFILLVSHEILASFIAIISRSGTGSKSLQHFMVVSAIYMANLVITVLHEIGSLNWNFIYVNLYLLLTLSAIVGLWGFKNREPMYGNIFTFEPLGAFFFLALGCIAFGTIAQLLGNANDAALQVVRYSIIFSHLGFGFIFITYILSNFADLLGNNRPVYRVLYQPTRMPYFSFQFAGLIVTLAFVFYTGWREYVYHSLSGFYTSLGDLDTEMNNRTYSLAHYETASKYGFRNFHSNYAVAQLKTTPYSLEEAHNAYRQANGKRPTDYSLLNNANLHLWENNPEEAILAYKHVAGRLTAPGELTNNMGFAFQKSHNIDSAVYYLNEARSYDASRPSAEANFFALATLGYLPVKADSVIKLFDTTYTATLANALALANTQQQELNIAIDPLANTHLDLYTATLLNNYLVRNTKTLDTATLERVYRIASIPYNENYSESIKVALASAFYHKGNVTRSLSIMAELAFISQKHSGRYNYLMGLWAMEQQNPVIAASYFDYSLTQEYKEAKFYRAIALTEAQKTEQARIAWDSLAKGNTAAAGIATHMKKVLSMSFEEALSMPDQEKYQYSRYRLNVFDTTRFNKLLPTFADNNYKAQALLDMSQRQFSWNNLNKAIRYFNQVSGLQITDEALYNRIRHFELVMLSERRELNKLATQINNGIEFTSGQALEKMLYTALINEANGDTIHAAKQYNILAFYNPYFEEGVIAAAQYFRTHGSDPAKPYTILSEAIQVNNTSVKLLQAYVGEAQRSGFSNYAAGAQQQIEEIAQEAKLISGR